LAWDTTRDYLLANWPSATIAGQFDLRRIFPKRWETHVIDLQLYFAKVLGCLVVEHNVAADLHGFIKALLHRQPHPLLRLVFADCSQLQTKSETLCYVSDPRVGRDTQARVQTVQIGYVLRPVSAQMIYATLQTTLRAIPAAWHPASGNSRVELGPAIAGDSDTAEI
jgi:hypothetical protein